MLPLFERLLGKRDDSAKTIAKDRLRAIILLDRADIPAPILEAMRKDIFAVMSRYVEINESELDVNLEKEDDMVALVANIPIRRLKLQKDKKEALPPPRR